MDSYNVAKAKTHLSEILAQVAAGEEVLLTKRGKPIARVVPIARTASVLGAGVDDANINHDVLTEDAWRKARSDDEAASWYE
jgi:prevent-host-death family protein